MVIDDFGYNDYVEADQPFDLPSGIIGLSSFTLIHSGYKLWFDGFVIDDSFHNMDVDILAGAPFMEHNDVAVRPSRHQIMFGDHLLITYGGSPSPRMVSETESVSVPAECKTECEHGETTFESECSAMATECECSRKVKEYEHGEMATEYECGETITECDCSAMPTECERGDTVTVCEFGETVAECERSERVTECERSETVTECEHTKPVPECDLSETVMIFEGSETMMENECESLTDCAHIVAVEFQYCELSDLTDPVINYCPRDSS